MLVTLKGQKVKNQFEGKKGSCQNEKTQMLNHRHLYFLHNGFFFLTNYQVENK